MTDLAKLYKIQIGDTIRYVNKHGEKMRGVVEGWRTVFDQPYVLVASASRDQVQHLQQVALSQVVSRTRRGEGELWLA